MELELRQRCFDYSLEVLLGNKELASEFKHLIHYGLPDDAVGRDYCLFIVPSGFFGSSYGKAESLPELPLKEIEGVPLLYGEPEIRRDGDRLIVHADIIASAYSLVTRYEEMVRRDVRDEHGRFPGQQSTAYRAGFIKRPIVDEYAALLRKWLREAGADVEEPVRKFSVLLTHDIDTVFKYQLPIRAIANSLVGKQRFSNIAECIAVKCGFKDDPNDTFDKMIELDSRLHNVDSKVIYFFMADGGHRLDGKYRIDSKPVRERIKLVQDSGAQIGLHCSYSRNQDPQSLQQQKTKLESACGCSISDNRYHYLTWREIEDGWSLAKAGFKRDYTLGYQDICGFRLGVCRPIELFDPVAIKPFGIIEHPLIVMECTLSSAHYMNLEETQALDYCLELIEQTEKHQGEFVMLWHNPMFGDNSVLYQSNLYETILKTWANADE
ncbi:MAG: polysaccharide deacetylase family protein [Planctomycetota bacterium]|jgi:hypothetical protein